ncbi:hypothetical protein NPIL_374071 [Nephila pilipes]|uniref:MD-2-related lipid-recognition domain-containing protein n=1 Tax=Nephila pilipes TaxID=299642 RepID=A0A8X6NZH7_NEPPI|nr:hypothetical protein NPIL_374071 [Nephila pilipes]
MPYFEDMVQSRDTINLRTGLGDGGKHIFTINKLSISPDPMSNQSTDIKVLIDFSLHEDIPPEARMHSAVWKVVNFYISEIYIQTAEEKDYDYLECVEYFTNAKDDCPVKAKRYIMEEYISIPDADELGKGEYLIEFKIMKDLEQLSCYHINFEIE